MPHGTETPQEAPQQATWDRWMDGEMGNRLWELADLSRPDVTEDGTPWPPFDIEAAIMDKLQEVKTDIGRLS